MQTVRQTLHVLGGLRVRPPQVPDHRRRRSIVTPPDQRPKWHDKCRRAALRSPLLHRTCKCGCGTRFSTRMPQKVFVDPDHRAAAAAARRTPSEPSIAFELDDEQQAAVDAMFGTDGDFEEMLASAHRVVHQERLRADPDYRASELERHRREEDAHERLQAADAATAVRLAAEEALRAAQAKVTEAQARVTVLDAEQAPFSTARARLAALDAELDASTAERERLNERLRLWQGPFRHNIHDADQVKARLDELNALAANRPELAQAAADAPAWEAAQVQALGDRRQEARRELEMAHKQVKTSEAALRNAVERNRTSSRRSMVRRWSWTRRPSTWTPCRSRWIPRVTPSRTSRSGNAKICLPWPAAVTMRPAGDWSGSPEAAHS